MSNLTTVNDTATIERIKTLIQDQETIIKIKKDQVSSQTDAMKKLIIATVICILFMTVEVVGGIVSNSLAILSDAAHLLSDFTGFAMSMVSIIISKKTPSNVFTYGYHRAEVLGALCSILLIWALTAWLVCEGIEKIAHKHPVENPKVMLYVAIFGLICNIIMGKTLHVHGHGHHHHGDSHHCHGDSHHHHEAEHHHHESCHSQSELSDNDSDPRKIQNLSNNSGIGINIRTKIKNFFKRRRGNFEQELVGNEEKGIDFTVSKLDEEIPDQENIENKAEESQKEIELKEISLQSEEKDNSVEVSANSAESNHECNHDNSHHEHHHNHDHRNMNVRAAFIHVLGDLIQSIGVIIAALIITFIPGTDIADPICTFIFSVVVLITTFPILLDCAKVFMEGTPNGVKIEEIKKKILQLPEVEEVHDLHIWTLNSQNLSLSCHIKTKKGEEALEKVTRLLNAKYKILHTTIQLEPCGEGTLFKCGVTH